MIKDLISNTFGKLWRVIPINGAFRFKVMYWAYRLTGWHIRHKEWDFVLEYFPKLANWQKVRVLDVGCSRTLFCYELASRGYKVSGIDLEVYKGKFPGIFYIGDITKHKFDDICKFNFVVCISVLEHIQRISQINAIRNMLDCLKIGGRLLLTIPTEEYAQGHDWKGFTYDKIEGFLSFKERIIEYTERAGQICLVIERIK